MYVPFIKSYSVVVDELPDACLPACLLSLASRLCDVRCGGSGYLITCFFPTSVNLCASSQTVLDCDAFYCPLLTSTCLLCTRCGVHKVGIRRLVRKVLVTYLDLFNGQVQL